MEYTPKIRNIIFDRVKVSTDFLDLAKLLALADLKSINFFPSKSPCYSRSALIPLGHSDLRILIDPVQPYLPPVQLDSFGVVVDEARQDFLRSLVPDANLSYLEIAVDFVKDDYLEDFLEKHFLMKYNKKGSNKFEATTYFGERKTSSKQIRIYPKECFYSPSDLFYRVEVFFKSKYLSRNHLSLASLSTHDFSDNVIKSISFKELNLKYLTKKLSPVLLHTLQNMPLAGAVVQLKQKQVDLRYALSEHPYQDVFNKKIKEHWEYLLSPVPDHDPFDLIDYDLMFA